MSVVRLLTLPALAAAMILAACGGGGGGQANNAGGLEQAATELWEAILEGDTDSAYEFLTDECQETVSARDFREEVSGFPELLETFFEVDPDDVGVDEVQTRDVDDGRGEALVVFSGPDDIPDFLNEGNEYQPWVYEGGSWRIDDCDDFGDGGNGDDPVDNGDDPVDSDDGDSSDDGDEAPDDGDDEGSTTSRSNPAPLGTTLEVAGWEITINSADPDATDEIVDSDSFIDPPEDGDVFFLINVTATYVGNGEDESQSIFSSITWGAVGDSAVGYQEFDDACTFFGLPDELDDSAEVFEGGTVSGNICFSVAEEDAGSLVLYAEDFFSFDGVREWFALR